MFSLLELADVFLFLLWKVGKRFLLCAGRKFGNQHVCLSSILTYIHNKINIYFGRSKTEKEKTLFFRRP